MPKNWLGLRKYLYSFKEIASFWIDSWTKMMKIFVKYVNFVKKYCFLWKMKYVTLLLYYCQACIAVNYYHLSTFTSNALPQINAINIRKYVFRKKLLRFTNEYFILLFIKRTNFSRKMSLRMYIVVYCLLRISAS